jgi:hypothetical protein
MNNSIMYSLHKPVIQRSRAGPVIVDVEGTAGSVVPSDNVEEHTVRDAPHSSTAAQALRARLNSKAAIFSMQGRIGLADWLNGNVIKVTVL